MTPQQQASLETLIGAALTQAQVDEIGPLVDARNDAAVAAALSVGRKVVVSTLVTARAVRAVGSVLPRSRLALLTALQDAASTEPAWLAPTLTALGVPTEDHPAMADDLASAWGALNSFTDGGGIDIGTSAARGMIDIIAAAVPAAAAACNAVKALAERPSRIDANQVSEVLNNG